MDAITMARYVFLVEAPDSSLYQGIAAHPSSAPHISVLINTLHPLVLCCRLMRTRGHVRCEGNPAFRLSISEALHAGPHAHSPSVGLARWSTRAPLRQRGRCVHDTPPANQQTNT
jgi:hypothetical protein